MLIPELKLKSLEELYGEMELLGEGVYALVYKTFNKKLNKVVALKIYKE